MTSTVSDFNMSMYAQKQRYGDRLYEKNAQTGKYRCFFCNKELRANFSRHISRHESEGDQVDQKLKHAIMNGLPLPPPSKSTPHSDPSPGNKRKESTPQLPKAVASSPNAKTVLEAQCYQIVFYITRNISHSLSQSDLIRQFIKMAKEQIPSSQHISLNGYCSTVNHLAQIMVIDRGEKAQEQKQMKEILGIFRKGYEEELCKLKVQQETFGTLTCAICNESEAMASRLVMCNGPCIRSFHVSCAISSDGVDVYQVSTFSPAHSIFCWDCKTNKKVLRFDPIRKQYYYFEYSFDNTGVPPADIENGLIIDEKTIAEGYRIEPTINSNQLSFTIPSHSKNPNKWYDPSWCIWREYRKEETSNMDTNQ